MPRQGSQWSSRTDTSRRRHRPARPAASQLHGQLLHRPPRLSMVSIGVSRRSLHGVTAIRAQQYCAAVQYAIPSPTGDCETASTMVASMDRSPHSATKISVATWTNACQADVPVILPLASAESMESRAPSSSPLPEPSGVSQASCSCRMSLAESLSVCGRPKGGDMQPWPRHQVLPAHLDCPDAKVH